jgi:hypothetical protein
MEQYGLVVGSFEFQKMLENCQMPEQLAASHLGLSWTYLVN